MNEITVEAILTSQNLFTVLVLAFGCTLAYIVGYWMGQEDERSDWTRTR